jgi:hypothetical protein
MNFKRALKELVLEKVFSSANISKTSKDRYDVNGKKLGKCGEGKPGSQFNICIDKQKAETLGKKGIAKLVKRKKLASNKPEKKSHSKLEESFTPDVFVVENFGGIKVQYPTVSSLDAEAYDIFITKNGQLFEINDINENDGNITLDIKYHNGVNEGYEDRIEIKINEEFGLVGEGRSDFINEYGELEEASQMAGKKVKLNKIMRGDVKKYKVYTKNDKGNVVKVNFGDPNMEIKRDDPARRKNFRARHNCEDPGPKWKAKYWACKTWSTKSVSSMLKEEVDSTITKEYKNKKGKWNKVAENFMNNISTNSLLTESIAIKQIENTLDVKKIGVNQSIAYLKQFFCK